MRRFGTKAENLEALYGTLSTANILPLTRFAVEEWTAAQERVLDRVMAAAWAGQSLIVRSSAVAEDRDHQSLAGKFCSIANVSGRASVRQAIDQVIASYGAASPQDQVFVQPMLESVDVSGVAFTRDPNTGSPYIVINYDDASGSTDSVTSGSTNELKTFYAFKHAPSYEGLPPALQRTIALLHELELEFGHDSLDVEFAWSKGELYLLQVRPLLVAKRTNDAHLLPYLEQIAKKIDQLNRPHPYLYGSRTVFGVMPDWNPAEIIGIRPRPLALSLYKEIITDSTWAYQRDNYGYKNLRSFPLLVHFQGLPYIDVRISFNSFLPADVDEALSDKLVNYYIDRLVESPSKHDKVEFDIIFSCYSFDLPVRLAALHEHGFSEEEITSLLEALSRLTNRIVGEEGLWRKDIEKIEHLKQRYQTIVDSDLDQVSKIYWLLEDCKRYGTLPFAGLARAGFIAVQMLRSLVQTELLSQQEYQAFMNSLDTVSSQMSLDFRTLSQSEFLSRYGHLRPGTYDILSTRYDEDPDTYFNWNEPPLRQAHDTQPFALSLQQLNKINQLLNQHEIRHDVVGLFNFLKGAIEGREMAKYVFTQSLSEALRLFAQFAEEQGFTKEEASFANISVIYELYSCSEEPKRALELSIQKGLRQYELTKQIQLPSLITSADDVWGFFAMQTEPNFITLQTAKGPVAFATDKSQLRKSIVFIESADPGYDWIFSHDIAGFVTMYGGANSHMAIRAGELGIPAIIGAGDVYYRKWSSASSLELDCANRLVRELV